MSNGGSGDPSSVTINGVSASKLASYGSASGQKANYSFWIADVPTDTTMSVDVVFPNARTRAHCTIWSVYGADNPTVTDSANSNFSTSATLTIDIGAGDIAFVLSHIRQTANYYMGYGDDPFASASLGHVIGFGTSSFTGITYRDRIFSESSGTTNQGEMFAISLNFPDAAPDVGVLTRVTQSPLLVLDNSSQEVRATQAPLLIVDLPNQQVKVTQAPLIVPVSIKPVPLPEFLSFETPVVETWEWLTSVNSSRKNYEQRGSLRATPRYLLSLDMIILSESDRSQLYGAIMRLMKQAFTVPLLQHSAIVTAQALSGATKLYFNPQHTDLRAGEDLCIHDPFDDSRTFVEVATVDVDGATLTTALSSDVSAGCSVSPAFSFRMSASVGFSMNAIDGSMNLTVESLNPRTFQRPGASPTLTTIDGLLIIKERPLADVPVREEFTQDVDWVDSGVSAPEPIYQWRTPFASGNRSYKFNRLTDMDYWRAVADYMKGSLKAFLLPTFRDDLPLLNQPALDATVLVTTNVQYFTYWTEEMYRYVRIQTANGPKYRKITEATGNYDSGGNIESVNLNLSSSIGNVAGDNVVTAVSFMNLSRLSDDKVTVTHYELDSILDLNVMAVNQ